MNLKYFIPLLFFIISLPSFAKAKIIEFKTEIDKINDNDVYIDFQFKNNELYGARYDTKKNKGEIWLFDEKGKRRELILDNVPGVIIAFYIGEDYFLTYYLAPNSNNYHLSSFNQADEETILLESTQPYIKKIFKVEETIFYGGNFIEDSDASYLTYPENQTLNQILSNHRNHNWTFSTKRLCYSTDLEINIGAPSIQCFNTETQEVETIYTKQSSDEVISSLYISADGKYLYILLKDKIFKINFENIEEDPILYKENLKFFYSLTGVNENYAVELDYNSLVISNINDISKKDIEIKIPRKLKGNYELDSNIDITLNESLDCYILRYDKNFEGSLKLTKNPRWILMKLNLTTNDNVTNYINLKEINL